MAVDYFDQFFITICAGFGLFLAGGVNLLLIRRRPVLRVMATFAALGLALGAAAALDYPGTVAGSARLLALGLLPCLLLGSRRLVSGVAALIAATHRPTIRFALLTVAGIAIAIGSIIVCERADETAVELSTSDLEASLDRTPSTPTERVKASTDRGTKIVLREPLAARSEYDLSCVEEKILHNNHLDSQVIRHSAPDDHSNCHGWVFTDGRFIVPGLEVELILKENGYHEEHDPHPGDLIVYRQNNTIAHTGIVRYVTEGQPVLIESKWGELGVFLHPADKTLYGVDFTFYHSVRHGHLLAGVSGPSTDAHSTVTAE